MPGGRKWTPGLWSLVTASGSITPVRCPAFPTKKLWLEPAGNVSQPTSQESLLFVTDLVIRGWSSQPVAERNWPCRRGSESVTHARAARLRSVASLIPVIHRGRQSYRSILLSLGTYLGRETVTKPVQRRAVSGRERKTPERGGNNSGLGEMVAGGADRSEKHSSPPRSSLARAEIRGICSSYPGKKVGASVLWTDGTAYGID